MAWNVRPLSKEDYTDEELTAQLEDYNSEFQPELCKYKFWVYFCMLYNKLRIK